MDVCNVIFVLLPLLLCDLAESTACSAGTVCQVHAALGGQPNSMRLTWISDGISTPSQVRYGFSSSVLDKMQAGSVETYSFNDFCNSSTCASGLPDECTKGYEDPGTIHHALLTGLPLGEDLYYSPSGSSEVFGPLHIGVKPAPDQSLLNFVVLGDMGAFAERGDSKAGDVNVTKVLKSLVDELDVVVHVGDLAYGNEAAYYWRYWMEEIEPVASRVPWMVACGNHDCLYAGQAFQPSWPGYFLSGGDGGECGVPFNSRFWMPGDASFVEGWRESRGGQRNNIFYSFSKGPVHFVLLSSEHNMLEGSVQLAWLKSDLQRVNRSSTPFVIVGQHRPFYSSILTDIIPGMQGLPEMAGMRKVLEPVLIEHGVDIVLCGHFHQYERSCPLVDGKCNAKGPVYMTVGNAGPDNYVPWGLKPHWAITRSYEHGVATFKVLNKTTLHVLQTSVQTGTTLDDFYVTSHHLNQPVSVI